MTRSKAELVAVLRQATGDSYEGWENRPACEILAETHKRHMAAKVHKMTGEDISKKSLAEVQETHEKAKEALMPLSRRAGSAFKI